MALRPGCAAFHCFTASNSRSSNSAWQRLTTSWTLIVPPFGKRGLDPFSSVLPLRLAIFDERLEALVRIARRHQLLEVERLHVLEPRAGEVGEVLARRAHGERERRGALARKMGVEVGERSGRGVVRHLVREAPGQRGGGIDRAPGVEQVFGARLADAQ